MAAITASDQSTGNTKARSSTSLESRDSAEAGVTWASRSSYWLEQSRQKATLRRRERENSPLILTGHGLSIRVDKGCLLVRDGNTHYPAEQREWRFFKGALDIPPSFVVIDGSGEITLDAIDWMSMQGTPLIRLRWDGQFASIVTAGGQAASTECVLWQKSLREHPEKRLAFAIDLIRRKIENTVATLESHVPRSRTWNRAHRNASVRAEWLGKRPPGTLDELLGIEGSVANDYFRAWSGIPVNWKATNRYPIPDDWQTYTSRATHRVGARRNFRATHPVNAMLNYSYGVITARTHVQLIADGYDPTIGVLHDNRARRGAYTPFALDHIEPLRPIADRAVLQIITNETLTGADFNIQDDGVCRLNPELARRIVVGATRLLDQ